MLSPLEFPFFRMYLIGTEYCIQKKQLITRKNSMKAENGRLPEERENTLKDPASFDQEETLSFLLASFRFLFEKFQPEEPGKTVLRCEKPLQKTFLLLTKDLLIKLYQEEKEKRRSFYSADSLQTDPLDVCNALLQTFSGSHSLRNTLDECLFSALLDLIEPEMDEEYDRKNFSDPASYPGKCIQHAIYFARNFSSFIRFYVEDFSENMPESSFPGRLLPYTPFLTLSHCFFCRSTPQAAAMELSARRKKEDIFHKGNVFRYRNGEFFPSLLPSIRKKEDFYGYTESKQTIGNHIASFASGRHNIPLLISGLPGLGKTQMTIAHILSDPRLILILPSPEDLEEGLEKLIRLLAARKDHSFVIFFDDMDTRNLNWYSFRTFVGGSYSLPENEMIIIASNYSFPPNISSRGRTFVFPHFDEIRCQEMIEDMLLAKGMEKVPPDLLSVIAADYVEAFGQKEFDELSPRTLARYMEFFLADQAKRKHLLEFSKGEIITRPDPLVFHEQNVRLMRALYGEGAIEELRKTLLPD